MGNFLPGIFWSLRTKYDGCFRGEGPNIYGFSKVGFKGDTEDFVMLNKFRVVDDDSGLLPSFCLEAVSWL